ncbi:hypothetical protein C8R47DRAFT_1077169 [Mycena vitilis]|nr:hypothetical protein C8R47DRAFT_1077169 [Mycena vitilis]
MAGLSKWRWMFGKSHVDGIGGVAMEGERRHDVRVRGARDAEPPPFSFSSDLTPFSAPSPFTVLSARVQATRGWWRASKAPEVAGPGMVVVGGRTRMPTSSIRDPSSLMSGAEPLGHSFHPSSGATFLLRAATDVPAPEFRVGHPNATPGHSKCDSELYVHRPRHPCSAMFQLHTGVEFIDQSSDSDRIYAKWRTAKNFSFTSRILQHKDTRRTKPQVKKNPPPLGPMARARVERVICAAQGMLPNICGGEASRLMGKLEGNLLTTHKVEYDIRIRANIRVNEEQTDIGGLNPSPPSRAGNSTTWINGYWLRGCVGVGDEIDGEGNESDILTRAG